MAMCKVSSSVHFVTRSVGSTRDGSRAHWVPNTDVYITDAGLVVKVELAGVRIEDIELLATGTSLTLRGGNGPRVYAA